MRNILFWLIITVCVVVLGGPLWVYGFEALLLPLSSHQQTFKAQCEALNGADLTLNNLLSLQGQCLEYRDNGAGFAVCTEKHLNTYPFKTPDSPEILVSSNWFDTGWRCYIETDQGKMQTRLDWYVD